MDYPCDLSWDERDERGQRLMVRDWTNHYHVPPTCDRVTGRYHCCGWISWMPILSFMKFNFRIVYGWLANKFQIWAHKTLSTQIVPSLCDTTHPWRCSLPRPSHSFKNRTGPAVQPEKTGTGASSGLLSAQDRTRKWTGNILVEPVVLIRTDENQWTVRPVIGKLHYRGIKNACNMQQSNAGLEAGEQRLNHSSHCWFVKRMRKEFTWLLNSISEMRLRGSQTRHMLV
jgi:hypothetical protein